ncbi:Spherulin-4 [Arthrobotrys entomopaga]|nr:Spherulin-4 [Arthrobotrys entomopaga]
MCASTSKTTNKASTKAPTSILIPLYVYPSVGAWDPLYNVIDSYPQQPFTVIINPNSGPGTSQFPDASYIAGVAKLKTFRNVKLIGYVHVSYTTRNVADVCADISKYAGWASYKAASIALSGIFVDEAPSEVGSRNVNLLYMRRVRNSVLQSFNAISQPGFTMTNPGTIADRQFYAYADSIVSYESPLSNYYDPDTLQTSIDMSKSAGTSGALQSIIVTSFTGSETRERYLLDNVVQRGIGEVYFTRDADYQAFGSDIFILVDEIARRNGLVDSGKQMAVPKHVF